MTGIRTETARMADLVEDLLLLARLDEGRPLANTLMDLADIAFEAVDAANAVAPDRPCTCTSTTWRSSTATRAASDRWSTTC